MRNTKRFLVGLVCLIASVAMVATTAKADCYGNRGYGWGGSVPVYSSGYYSSGYRGGFGGYGGYGFAVPVPPRPPISPFGVIGVPVPVHGGHFHHGSAYRYPGNFGYAPPRYNYSLQIGGHF